ncbi:hypothetical protein NQZ68_034212, partial [Dissostichus eleginoides]
MQEVEEAAGGTGILEDETPMENLPLYSQKKGLITARRAAPEVLLIHCGGNDLGDVSSVHLVNKMKEDLHQLHHRHPGMKIVLSQINQRCRWRAGASPVKIDKARRF